MISRRKFLAAALASAAISGRERSGLCASPGQAKPKRVTPANAFDPEVQNFMSERGVPGGALAVAKNGRLVYTRGYGWADREQRQSVRADSLFRIASISKPITAAAVLRLVEANRLTLDARVLDYIKLPAHLEPGGIPDKRWHQITVRQLLQHTGGWDRERSFDPMFRPRLIAKAVGMPPPANAEAIIRYMLGQPLDFDPGTRYAYSNFGYCVLGRIIEQITRLPYETFVRHQILAPLGMQRMRLGASLEEGRAAGEVRYYMPNGETKESVFPARPGPVLCPYGGFNLEAMDAHGGWIAAATDLIRFATVLDPRARHPLLKPETLRLLAQPPPPPVSRQEDGSLADHYYACGWMIRPVRATQLNYWHAGSLPGTNTLLVRRWDGLSWAVLFNQRSENDQGSDLAIDAALHRAADAVTVWE